MNRVYTVGYGGHRQRPAHLLETVVAAGGVVVDVRLSARSRLPQWSGAQLRAVFGDRYEHVPELGNRNYKRPGCAVELVDAEAGIARVLSLLADQPVVLLCGCADWRRCHRRVVAELLAECSGAVVEHLGLGLGLGLDGGGDR